MAKRCKWPQIFNRDESADFWENQWIEMLILKKEKRKKN